MATIVNCIGSNSSFKYKFLIENKTKVNTFGNKCNIVSSTQTCYITLDILIDGIELTEGNSKGKTYGYWNGKLDVPSNLKDFNYVEKTETFVKDDEEITKTVLVITGPK